MRGRGTTFVGASVIVVTVLIVLAIFSSSFLQVIYQDDEIITVQEKERVVQGESSRYLIWSEEGETFQNTDNILFWKWNSSDIYGQLKEGHKYQIHVGGLRVHIFSWYRNIITVEEIVEDTSDPQPE